MGASGSCRLSSSCRCPRFAAGLLSWATPVPTSGLMSASCLKLGAGLARAAVRLKRGMESNAVQHSVDAHIRNIPGKLRSYIVRIDDGRLDRERLVGVYHPVKGICKEDRSPTRAF